MRIYNTGFDVRNTLLSNIQIPAAISARLSHLNLNTKEGNIFVILAYTPTLKAESTVKDLRNNQLEVKLNASAEEDRVIAFGDMNALVRESDMDEVYNARTYHSADC